MSCSTWAQTIITKSYLCPINSTRKLLAWSPNTETEVLVQDLFHSPHTFLFLAEQQLGTLTSHLSIKRRKRQKEPGKSRYCLTSSSHVKMFPLFLFLISFSCRSWRIVQNTILELQQHTCMHVHTQRNAQGVELNN